MRWVLIILGLILFGFFSFKAGQKSVIPITKTDSVIVYKTKVIDSIKIEYKELKKVAKIKKDKVDSILVKCDTSVQKSVQELDSVRVLQIAKLENVIVRQNEVIELKDSLFLTFCTPVKKKKHKVLKIAASILLIGLFIIK